MKAIDKAKAIFVLFAFAVSLAGCKADLLNRSFCEDKKVGDVYIGGAKIEPLNVESGGNFNHRVELYFCDSKHIPLMKFSTVPYAQVELTRKIVLDGKVLKRNLELRNVEAGRNSFQADIEVPKDVNGGIYILRTEIKYNDTALTREDRFNVISH